MSPVFQEPLFQWFVKKVQFHCKNVSVLWDSKLWTGWILKDMSIFKTSRIKMKNPVRACMAAKRNRAILLVSDSFGLRGIIQCFHPKSNSTDRTKHLIFSNIKPDVFIHILHDHNFTLLKLHGIWHLPRQFGVNGISTFQLQNFLDYSSILQSLSLVS